MPHLRFCENLYLKQLQSCISQRIVDVLAHLDSALLPADMDLPGYRLHALKGDLKGRWSVSITGNRRIIFRFEDGDCFDVD